MGKNGKKTAAYMKELLKTDCVFEKEQLDALRGAAPMTQKVFEEVLEICTMIEDLEGYLAVWDSFPECARQYAEQTDSEE